RPLFLESPPMARPRAASTDPEGLTLADLRRALDKKEGELRQLLARKDALAHELERLGEVLQAMLAGSGAAAPRGSGGPGGPRVARAGSSGPAPEAKGRAKAHGARRRAAPAIREGSLQTAIRAVLERVIGPLKVAEIVAAVRQAGYASRSSNLNVIVSNRL